MHVCVRDAYCILHYVGVHILSYVANALIRHYGSGCVLFFLYVFVLSSCRTLHVQRA